jgi:hypothetical protein
MINRPIPAPQAYFPFKVFGITSTLENELPFDFTEVFPNPASAITYIGVNSTTSSSAKIYLMDVQGKIVNQIHNGALNVGVNKFFIDAAELSGGIYLITIENNLGQRVTKKLVVQ